MSRVTNILLVGVGGQGVLKASQILAESAFSSGHDVKQSEVHGMSQRGGSVECQVRFGERVASPLILRGAIDYVIALDAEEGRRARRELRPGGVFVAASPRLLRELPSVRSLNVALLGALSSLLPMPEATWLRALRRLLPKATYAMNRQAFVLGRCLVEPNGIPGSVGKVRGGVGKRPE